jgi:hypothetical protein
MAKPDRPFMKACESLTDADLAAIEKDLTPKAEADPIYALPKLVAVRMIMTTRLMKTLGSDEVIHCTSEDP